MEIEVTQRCLARCSTFCVIYRFSSCSNWAPFLGLGQLFLVLILLALAMLACPFSLPFLPPHFISLYANIQIFSCNQIPILSPVKLFGFFENLKLPKNRLRFSFYFSNNLISWSLLDFLFQPWECEPILILWAGIVDMRIDWGTFLPCLQWWIILVCSRCFWTCYPVWFLTGARFWQTIASRHRPTYFPWVFGCNDFKDGLKANESCY